MEDAILHRSQDLLVDVDQRENEMSIGSAWEDKILDWCMSDPDRKTRILQFIDVFPSLRTDAAIVDHLRCYFPESSDRIPLALRTGLRFTGGLLTSRWVSSTVKMIMTQMARRFIGGETEAEAAECVARLKAARLDFSLDFLGEATLSEDEADHNLKSVLSMLNSLSVAPAAAGARINFSIKCSSLTSYLDPVDPDEVARRLLPRIRILLREAASRRAFIHFDAEQYDICDLTLDLLLQGFDEPEFHRTQDVGVVLQAYLTDAEDRAARLIDWCEKRGRTLTVRLVKGAYWDSEVIRARRMGWRVPVYLNKWESDACFERMLYLLMKSHRHIRLAVASHNVRSIAAALSIAQALEVPADRLEFQFLYGMARATRQVLAARGYQVRVYTPYGQLIPGMAYLVRRLLENSSNESFLRHRRLGGQPALELLKSPHAAAAEIRPPAGPAAESPAGFRNAPAVDFHKRGIRDAMARAVRDRLNSPPEKIGPLIGGRRVPGKKFLMSLNPSHPHRVVAEVDLADAGHVEEAARCARRGWETWRKTSAADRGKILHAASSLLAARRHELAALEICEAGKPWEEAEADVAEAIDYLRYYPMEADRIERGIRLQPEIPGEINSAVYKPRGVAAVISPWNFPLAIPAGQTAAALAAGNCVILKPSEQTSLIGYRLVEIYRQAGVPEDVIQFLPGFGEEVGAALVTHPEIDLVAFTGSRAVGEEILSRSAAAGIAPSGPKRVIAEMGGKNAVIVDSDADVDLAVADCLRAAFDYAGQKCSALSRLIVMEDIFDAVLKRFAESAKSYPAGYSEIPSTRLSPLIDVHAQKRVTDYLEIASREGQWILAPDGGRVPREGYFVPPAVLAGSSPRTRTAQEEIFGPLVVALPAKSLGHALEIANGTAYALTGGFYSRHPGRIARVRAEFDVGNLYINRAVTGAVVGRQPFGGHRSSGVGSKAGGPDYLLQFYLPVTVSENISRHGFSPDISR